MIIYPYSCTRCGICCLSETCPNGMLIYKVGKKDRCPGLSFEDNVAQCGGLVLCQGKGMPSNEIAEVFGIGKGCCILGRVFVSGKAFDIASLPPSAKVLAAKQLRKE